MANKFLKSLPPTRFGATLKMTAEQEETCKMVYRKSEKDESIYVFDSLWNPDVEYKDNYVIVPLRSTAVDKVYQNAGFEFANIVGSTHDNFKENHNPNWLDVMRSNGISEPDGGYVCATDGKFYDPETGGEFEGKACSLPSVGNHNIVGGHVIAGQNNMKFEAKDKKTVLLIPICKHHNSYRCGTKAKIGNGNGEGFFMKLKQDQYVLALLGYLN